MSTNNELLQYLSKIRERMDSLKYSDMYKMCGVILGVKNPTYMQIYDLCYQAFGQNPPPELKKVQLEHGMNFATAVSLYARYLAHKMIEENEREKNGTDTLQ